MVIILMLILLLFLHRSRGHKDDRNLHLFKSLPNGSQLAYIQELDVPILPQYVSSKLFVWQPQNTTSKNQAEPLVIEPEPDIDHSLFVVTPVLSWSADSAVAEGLKSNLSTRLWNEEEAIAEAQQRRKDQRESAWSKQKLERFSESQEFPSRESQHPLVSARAEDGYLTLHNLDA